MTIIIICVILPKNNFLWKHYIHNYTNKTCQSLETLHLIEKLMLPLKLRPLPMAYLFIIPPKRSDLSQGPGRFGMRGLILGPDIPTASRISCKLLLNISIYLSIVKKCETACMMHKQKHDSKNIFNHSYQYLPFQIHKN